MYTTCIITINNYTAFKYTVGAIDNVRVYSVNRTFDIDLFGSIEIQSILYTARYYTINTALYYTINTVYCTLSKTYIKIRV